ncbi:hypothetical protein GW17_00006876 [Ensete ventricosum]|nr:hypothetical protein GW17_00006876 [Ensete ventricosum]
MIRRCLAVEKSKQLCVKLFPEVSSLTREQPPIASFVIKVVSPFAPNRKTLIHPGIYDRQLKNSDDFVWAIDTLLPGRFIIDVEFVDLKIVPSSVCTRISLMNSLIFRFLSVVFGFSHVLRLQGGEPSSIWGSYQVAKLSAATALTTLGRMLTDGIHTDITINARGGSIGSHRAVLAARSPVFRSMFSHDLKEKELSAVDICDMSLEACRAFLDFIYGNFQADEFLGHRLALLRAADKYDLSDLKEACHESLLEDIDANNVLERLQTAHLHHLPELKTSCMRYLVAFGKMYELGEDLSVFLQTADRELIAEIFQAVLAAWKGF